MATLSSSSGAIEALPPVTRLSPSVIRILGDNPSKFTLQGTNTYLLGTGPSRILLDTGEGKPAWKDRLAEALRDEKATIKTVLLSHWHRDHVGGVDDVKALVRELGGGGGASREDDVQVFKHQAREEEHDIQDGDVFEAEGIRLRAAHTPGHTTDHMIFLDEEADAMFTGDNVLGHGTAVFEDLATYLSSLHKMQTLFRGRAYPGHGPVVEDGPRRIREYVEHRKEREEQVIRAMRSRPTASGSSSSSSQPGLWTVMETVKIVYKDVPENLHVPAAGGVLQILKKLEREGRVEAAEGDGQSEAKWRLKERSTL